MTFSGFLRTACGREALRDVEWEALGEVLDLSGDYLDIVKGIFDNHTKEKIAADLRLTTHAVDGRMRYLYMHLHVKSRPQLIVKVFAVWKAICAK